jgi:hypothetical protein
MQAEAILKLLKRTHNYLIDIRTAPRVVSDDRKSVPSPKGTLPPRAKHGCADAENRDLRPSSRI